MQTGPQNKPIATWKPTAAGVLSIVAGALAVLTGLGALRRGEFVGRLLWHWRFEVVGIVGLVLGIVAIIGGIFALRRSTWGLALAGSICALYPPHTAVLGILSVIFVSLAKSEFDRPASRQSLPPPNASQNPPLQQS
jgi:hypothetical protein